MSGNRHTIQFAFLTLTNVLIAYVAWHSVQGAEGFYVAMVGSYHRLPFTTRVALHAFAVWPASHPTRTRHTTVMDELWLPLMLEVLGYEEDGE